jgi:hypothetical protein
MGRSQVTNNDTPIDIVALLTRRMIWDTVPCSKAAATIPKFGLMPASAEGDDFEHRASHSRLNRLAPITDELTTYSTVAGTVIGRAILDSHGSDGTEDVTQYINLVRAGVQTVMANLISDGLIHINGGLH